MKKHLTSIISLTLICAVTAVLLAVTNYITKPVIDKNSAAAANEALKIVMPNGEGFEKADISQMELPSAVLEAYSEKSGGYVIKLETAGYASGMVIMCGIDKDGKVTGATCLSSGETLGYEKTYGEKVVGADAETIDGIDTVATATKTTLAYRNAVRDALSAAIILGGGSVDLRDEAQILNDNLSAALPSAEGKFIKEFLTVKLESGAAVYKAENNSGFVFKIEDKFFGVKDGAVNGEADEALKAQILADLNKIANTTITEIDITGKELPVQIVKVYKTNNSSYVFELKAAGYGIQGDKYTASREYIQIKASVSSEGEIINCETVYENETENVGDACASESFYSQFNGKTESNAGEIDGIAGATITTKAYKDAISAMFSALNTLKGGAN